MATSITQNVAAFPTTLTVPKIGQLLVELGLISKSDIERILNIQEKTKLPFGVVAKSLQLVQDDDIQRALAKQFNFPYLRPGDRFCSPELITAYDPFSDTSEVFRSLRSQLILRWFRHHEKELCIVSADGTEDSSLFVANLAIVFAQLGKRTLLVDANMRQSHQCALFDFAHDQGLSEILAGRASTELIATPPQFPNLSLLSSGARPPNPTELISSETFSTLRSEVSVLYDIVLYDVPSFACSSEALMVAAEIGAALVVAKRHSTRIAKSREISRQLHECNVKIIGSVLV